MKKALLIGCPVALLLGIGGIVGLVYLVFWATSGPVDAADEFLALTAQGKYHEAYVSTSRTLQDQQDEEFFTVAIKELRFDEYESAFWNSRQIRNNHATLQGTITTKNGETIPVAMQLLHEGGEWRLLSADVPGVIVQPPAPTEVPSQAELNQLVARSLLDFNEALQAQDFALFYATTSNVWQQQTTPEQLKEAFQPLVDENIDLAEIESLTPVHTKPPAIDDNGILILEGYYPTQPLRFAFTLKFTDQQGEWKLFGVHVQAIEEYAEEPSMDDWILVREGSPEAIKSAVIEHTSLFTAVKPLVAEVRILQLASGEFAVVMSSPIPPYEFTNLVCWLDNPPDDPSIAFAVGWYTAPGDRKRYFLRPDPHNDQGDTLIGTTRQAETIQIYLPETTLSPLAANGEWQEESTYDLASAQELDRFQVTVDADASFGNPTFSVSRN